MGSRRVRMDPSMSSFVLMGGARQIFRFYIKCPSCSAEITFKTDPK